MIGGLLCAGFGAWAQSGKVTGRILLEDGSPARGASLQVDDAGEESETDDKGNFTLDAAAGQHMLNVYVPGQATRTISIQVQEGNVASLGDLRLKQRSTELDEVVIGASRGSYNADKPSSSLRLETPLLEVPQNIQVVTGKVLADQQVISMSDGLTRNVSGAVRHEHWGDLYTNITMRGSQIQAFRNGFNVVSSYWGPLTEDMSYVDHIEFVKGPAGFMLANGDPSGLYNVVTKKPTGTTKGEASFTMGSWDLYRATLDLDGKLSRDGRLLYRLNVAGQNKGSFRANEFNNRYSIAPVISYQVDDRTKLTLEYTWQQARMSDVGSYYVFSPDGYATLPRNFTAMPPGLAPTVINDHSLFANLQRQLNPDWKLTAQLAYLNYSQQGTSMWPWSVNPDGTMIRGVGIWDAKSEMTLGQAFLNGRIRTGGLNQYIIAGLDMGKKSYMADWSASLPLDTVGGEFNPKDPSTMLPSAGYPVFDRSRNLEARATLGGGLIDQRYTGIYLQDELRMWDDRIRLTLAGRYTFVTQSNYGGPAETAKRFTPRVGLSISIDRQTAVYGLYDQAFTPQAGKLSNGGSVKPVTGSNTEFGIKRSWADNRWSTTLSVYRIVKNNELTADPNAAPSEGLSIVLGQKRAQGIEFDLRGELISGLNLTANYAYTDSKVTEVAEGVTEYKVGDAVPGFARHVANAWLSYQVQSGLLKGAGISAGATGMFDRALTNWSETDTRMNLPDYFKLDGGIFWENSKLRVNLNVFNILDKYIYNGGYYEWLNAYYWQADPGRNWRLSVAYRF